MNWSPCRFKLTRPFRRKTKSGFCTCTITFQLAHACTLCLNGMLGGDLHLTHRWRFPLYRHLHSCPFPHLTEDVVLARVVSQYECTVSETKVSDCTSTVKYAMFRLMSPGSAKETQWNMDSLLRFRSGRPFALCEVLLSLEAVVSWVRRGSVPDVTHYTTRHALLPRRDRARVAEFKLPSRTRFHPRALPQAVG